MSTVNESETIAEAQRGGLVRNCCGTDLAHAFGCRFAVAPQIDRS
jgi:hypothetical protein